MFQLSSSQLKAASDWDPVEPGYGRGVRRPFAEGVDPIVKGLRQRHWLGVTPMESGGLENYAHVFLFDSSIFPKNEEDERWRTTRHEGVSIYLSLLGPYAAIGMSGHHMSYDKRPEAKGIGGGSVAMIFLRDVMSEPPADDTVAQAAFNEVRKTPYRILTQQELGALLPDGMTPMDFQSSEGPPYTVFDLLFNRTD